MSLQEETLTAVAADFVGRYYNPTSRKSVKRDVDKFVRWAGAEKRIGDLSVTDVDRYISRAILCADCNPRGGRYKPNTARGKLKILARFLAWCYERGYLADRLQDVVAYPPEPEPETRDNAYTLEEVDRIIAYCAGATPQAARDVLNLALVLLAFDTGGRVASLRRLQRQHVDLDRLEVTYYNTKRKRWYKAAFGRYTANVLREYLATLPGDPTAYLWHRRQPGRQVGQHTLGQIVRRMCHALEIAPKGIHGFRRLLGVRMVDAGESIPYVAAVLDNSEAVARRHYAPREVPAALDAAREVAYVPEHERKVRRFKSG